jgi:hypothetical protein
MSTRRSFSRSLFAVVAGLALAACAQTSLQPSEAGSFRKIPPAKYALSFSSSYVNVSDNDLLDLTTTWTLEAWVYPRAAGNGVDQDIVSKWGGNPGASYILQIDATGVLRLVTADGTNDAIVLGVTTLSNDLWQHVAATFDHGTVKLYLNGVLDRTVTGVLTPYVGTQAIAFGREGAYPGGTISADLDEIRIWNVVRSAANIADHDTARLRGNEHGLVGYWRFDEGAGQVARDATGHGLDGRLGDTTGPDGWDPIWTSNAAPVH